MLTSPVSFPTLVGMPPVSWLLSRKLWRGNLASRRVPRSRHQEGALGRTVCEAESGFQCPWGACRSVDLNRDFWKIGDCQRSLPTHANENRGAHRNDSRLNCSRLDGREPLSWLAPISLWMATPSVSEACFNQLAIGNVQSKQRILSANIKGVRNSSADIVPMKISAHRKSRKACVAGCDARTHSSLNGSLNSVDGRVPVRLFEERDLQRGSVRGYQ